MNNQGGLMNAELIMKLREDAEWAHANEWETPITLGDHLDAAADALDTANANAKLFDEATARAEAAEAELDACKADLKLMADWYRESVCDDGICGLCKQDADHGLDGYANECAGFYKNDCFEWRGPQTGKGGPK